MNYHPLVSDIRFIIKNSKYIIPILSFIAVAEIFIYYKSFGIDISSFVSFSDFFLLAIDESLLRILIYLLLSIAVAAFVPLKYSEALGNERISSYSMTFIKRQKRNGPSYLGIILSIVSYFVFRKRYSPYEYFGIQYLSTILFFSIYIIKDEFIVANKLFFTETMASFHNTVMSMVFLIFLMSQLMIEKISNVKLKTENQKTYTFTSMTITCQDSFKLIGKTSNFVFFYNKKLNQSLIVPTSELKEISIKN